MGAGFYLVNALFGQRWERKWNQLVGAILYAGGWWGIYEVHNTAGLATFYIVQ